MTAEEQTAYADANPGAKSTLEKIIVQGYKALGLMYFFTAGTFLENLSLTLSPLLLKIFLPAPLKMGPVPPSADLHSVCS